MSQASGRSQPPVRVTDPRVIRSRIAQFKGWHQRIELAPGIVTPGVSDSATVLARLDDMGLPGQCSGLRALDIGCCDGFYSFEMEKRGAEVIGMDTVVPSSTGFPIASEILGSGVQYVVDNVYNLSPDKYGTFDIVLCLGVLYHLRNPMLAFDRIRGVMNPQGLLYVESAVLDDHVMLQDGSFTSLAALSSRLAELPLAQFSPRGTVLGDSTVKWIPSMAALRRMVEDAQFRVCDGTLHGSRGLIKAQAVRSGRLEDLRAVDYGSGHVAHARPQVLICGAAGYSNLGDDAILEGMLAQLRGVADADFTVVGGERLSAMADRLRFTALRHEQPRAWLRAIERADLVLIGGGGLLYDSTFVAGLEQLLHRRSDWLYQSVKIVAAARTAGKPVALFGVGVGPLLTDAGRRAARFVADCAEWITTRDEHSTRLLIELGVPSDHVHTAADPAMFVPSAPADAAAQLLTGCGLAQYPRPWIALNARPWYNFPPSAEGEERARQLRHALAKVADAVIAKTGGSLLLLPLQTAGEDDRPVLTDVSRMLEHKERVAVLDTPDEPAVVQAVVGELDLVIGMKLHSLILAANTRTPFIALSYMPKVDAFAAAMGQVERCFPIEAIAVEQVAAAAERALSERDSIRAVLATTVEEMRATGAVSVELAAATLGRRDQEQTPAGPQALEASRAAVAERVSAPPEDDVVSQAAQIRAYAEYVRALEKNFSELRAEFDEYVAQSQEHARVAEEYARALEEHARSLEEHARSLEEHARWREQAHRRELEAITSRRLYRWSEWLALKLNWLLRRR